MKMKPISFPIADAVDRQLCIVRIVEGEITGWLIASDSHDARHKLNGAGLPDLAGKMYQMEFPEPGKHDLGDGYWLLVDERSL